MDDTQENEQVRVAESEPSRPGTITVIGLAALVVGFFVVIFTAKDSELERQKQATAAPAATTQATQTQ